jgi:hypothetical protein
MRLMKKDMGGAAHAIGLAHMIMSAGLPVRHPAGTGMPIRAISARLAPLPPSSSFIAARPSALPPPKE